MRETAPAIDPRTWAIVNEAFAARDNAMLGGAPQIPSVTARLLATLAQPQTSAAAP